MAITKFSDHTPTNPLTVYCSPDDVRVYLAGVAADDDGSPFEGLLSRPRIDEAISKWSKVVKSLIDGHCKRDFDYHEDVEVCIDGLGSDVINLKPFGFCPLVELASLTIDNFTEDVDNYVIYTDDAVIARSTFLSLETPVYLSGVNTFIAGRQNVVATITWGYQTVPARVEAAAAYLTGAMLLNPADSMSDLRSPGVSTMASSVTYGDVKIGFGSTQPPYAALAKRLKADAAKLLAGYVIQNVRCPDPAVASGARNLRRYNNDGMSFH